MSGLEGGMPSTCSFELVSFSVTLLYLLDVLCLADIHFFLDVYFYEAKS